MEKCNQVILSATKFPVNQTDLRRDMTSQVFWSTKILLITSIHEGPLILHASFMQIGLTTKMEVEKFRTFGDVVKIN